MEFGTPNIVNSSLSFIDNKTNSEFINTIINPNPFKSAPKMIFCLPEDGYLKLSIFTSSGQVLSSVVNNEFYNKGIYEVELSNLNSDISSGIYFGRIELHGTHHYSIIFSFIKIE